MALPGLHTALAAGKRRSLAAALAAATLGFAAAGEPIERLQPASFAQLPASVRSGLTRLGCTIPQPFTAKRPQNVIQGSFTARAAKEWAVLCSVNGSSEILIFRSNSPEPVARLEKAEDDIFVQVVSPGQIGYSRLIVAGPRNAAGLNSIHDAFIEKASTIWVRVGRRWQSKTGAD